MSDKKLIVDLAKGTQTYVDLTPEEIEQLYKQNPCLSSQQVAETIITALNLRLDRITIVPHGDQSN